MKKLKGYWASAREKMKGSGKVALLFVAFMVCTVLLAHFYAQTRVPGEVAVAEQQKTEVVAVAPAPVQEAALTPSPEVKVYTTRVPTSVQAGTQDQRPIVVEIRQTQPAPSAQPAPAPAPKEMPEHLKLTPENIARTQNINRAGGATDEFDVDFDQEPEKEVKK